MKSSREIVKHHHVERLTRLQFRLLEYLCNHHSHIVETKDLMQYAWGDGCTISKQELYVYIAQLRKLLDGCAKIIAVREKGYILVSQ